MVVAGRTMSNEYSYKDTMKGKDRDRSRSTLDFIGHFRQLQGTE